MVMSPASLSAVGPLTLPVFAPAAFVFFGATVLDVVAPVPTGVTVIIRLLSISGPVSVAVVAAGLVRHMRRRRVGSSLGLFWHAGLVMVMLVAGQKRPVVRLNNQRPVEVGLHIGPDVESRGQEEMVLELQFTVEGLTARLDLPPQLVGPLLPHRHCLH